MNEQTNEEIGKTCVEFCAVATELRAIHSRKKEAQEKVEGAENRRDRCTDAQEKANASTEVATCLRDLASEERQEAQAKRKLSEHAEQIKRLAGADFDIMVTADAIVQQYEEQLRSQAWRLGPYSR